MALNFQRGQLAPFLRKPMGMMGQSQPGNMGGQQVDLQQPMPQAPAPAKGKFDWNMLAGIVGDSLAGLGGVQGSYAPAMQAQQEQLAEEQRWREKLQMEAAERRANRTPYRTEDNAGNVHQLDEETGQFKPIFVDPNDKQFVVDGQLVKVPNALRGGAQAAPAPPEGAISMLRGNPSLRGDFDAKYGPGAADRILGGGATPQQAGHTLGGAARTQMISRGEAQRIQQSLGPNGQAQFQQWVRDNGIQIGDY